MNHALDRPVAGVSVDRRSRKHERVYLVGEARRHHRRHPAALAETDEVHTSPKVVDRHDDLGEIIVDLQVLHVVGCGFPIGQRDVTDSVGQQRLDQALPLVVIGDHGRMPGVRRVHQRRNPAGLP